MRTLLGLVVILGMIMLYSLISYFNLDAIDVQIINNNLKGE